MENPQMIRVRNKFRATYPKLQLPNTSQNDYITLVRLLFFQLTPSCLEEVVKWTSRRQPDSS